MTAPTPAEAFPPRRPVEVPITATARSDAPPLFFATAWTRSSRTAPANRARTRDTARAAADRLSRELARLQHTDESDLDLRLESYRRAAARLDDALDAFDQALADPSGPPVPPPTARDL